MKLTGKCAEAFEKWLIDNYRKAGCRKGSIHIGEIKIRTDLFYEIPFSMQYGVLVDFFDSVGHRIEITQHGNEHGDLWWCYYFDKGEDMEEYKTRHEARTEAIKAANEIFNEKKLL